MEFKCITILLGCCLMATVAVANPFEPSLSNGRCMNNVAKVEVTLYYEALCGGCQYFITKELAPALPKIGSIMNVTMLPYGNADEKKVGDKWVFTCQHGHLECVYNTLESCAIHYQPKFDDHFPFLLCIETNTGNGWKQTLDKCASKIKTPKDTLATCTTGPIGNEALHHVALQTGPHDYVPFTLIDGKEMKYGTDFIKNVCDAYKGTKPAGCNQ